MTKFEVTLKQLRQNKACVSGYNKVVSALKGIEYVERKTYIRFKHDAPISLLLILESNGLDDALWYFGVNDEWSRDNRLFAVWCARQVQHLMKDERSIKALDVAEKFANGLASEEELSASWAAASAAAWAASCAAASAAASAAAWAAACAAASAAASATARDAASAAAWATARDAAMNAASAAAWVTARAAARAAQKQMFIKMLNGEAHWQVK